MSGATSTLCKKRELSVLFLMSLYLKFQRNCKEALVKIVFHSSKFAAP